MTWADDARDFVLEGEWMPDYLADKYAAVTDALIQEIEAQAYEWGGARLGRILGDCHRGNILWTDGGPHFVDLDDCLTGPAIQDVWMLLSGGQQEMRSELTDILKGYEQFLPFDRGELALIEPLRALRMIHYSGWLARRWHDPAFPRAFPWFAEPRYWEDALPCARGSARRGDRATPRVVIHPLFGGSYGHENRDNSAAGGPGAARRLSRRFQRCGIERADHPLPRTPAGEAWADPEEGPPAHAGGFAHGHRLHHAGGQFLRRPIHRPGCGKDGRRAIAASLESPRRARAAGGRIIPIRGRGTPEQRVDHNRGSARCGDRALRPELWIQRAVWGIIDGHDYREEFCRRRPCAPLCYWRLAMARRSRTKPWRQA